MDVRERGVVCTMARVRGGPGGGAGGYTVVESDRVNGAGVR